MYSIVNTAILGHNSDANALSGLALGTTIMQLVVVTPPAVYGGAAGNFISQSFGAGEIRLCSVYRNRMIFLNTVNYIVMALILALFYQSIISTMKMDEPMAAYTYTFMKIVIPFSYFEILRFEWIRFALSQKVTNLGPVSDVVGALLHSTLMWYFYFVLDWGFEGVCWATSCMFFFRCVFLICLVLLSEKIKKFDDVNLLTWETVSNLTPLVTLGFKYFIFGIWNVWPIQIYTMIASYMGPI